jgi:WD40 repeat protein
MYELEGLLPTPAGMPVGAVDIAPDGDTCVIGRYADRQHDESLSTWSLSRRSQRTVLVRKDGGAVNHVRFSPNGSLIAFADPDRSLVVKDINRGTVQTSISLRRTKWLTFGRRCDRLLASGRQVHVWEASTGVLVWTLPGAPLADEPSIEPPVCALDPQGQHVAASGAEPGNIVLYEIATSRIVRRFATSMVCARSIDFDPSGTYLAAVAPTGGAGLWNVHTGEELFVDAVNMRAKHYWSARFHPGGRHLALGHVSGRLQVLTLDDGKDAMRSRERRHSLNVFDLAFSPDGRRLVSVGGDKAVIWSWAP